MKKKSTPKPVLHHQTTSPNKLILFGILFHLIYIFSIFDIYFISPLVHGMQPINLDNILEKTNFKNSKDLNHFKPPAKRVVLVVADGLRADTIFNAEPEPLAPHLRSTSQERGVWGVSHTRVPTESRPGHVAVIAGFYEDVSAVTKGWKLNPVNFDSVFNQSTITWSFGSPDILPMFAEGAANPDRVKTVMYGAEEEDFSKDPTQLDTWVFDKFNELLEGSKMDQLLHQQLHQDGVVIFLHLLGLDTAGHAYRPNSKEYRECLRNVDSGLKALESKLADFYNHDNATSFLFTADHGMGNRGSHGDGHPDNTRTPMIAWGAGIKSPNQLQPPTLNHPQYPTPKEWQMDHNTRYDTNQADLAPLMSSLLGINYPMNSVGVIPLDILDAKPAYRATTALANAQVILEQYHVKNLQKQATELWFKSFPEFDLPNKTPGEIISEIESLIINQQYDAAEAESLKLMRDTLQGLRYLQTYDWLFLRSLVSLGYIGWIFYSLQFVIQNYAIHTSPKPVNINNNNTYIHIITGIFAITLYSLLIIQKSPWNYYLYGFFPLYFWNQLFCKIYQFKLSNIFFDFKSLIPKTIVIIVWLQLLVVTYFYREFLSLILVVIAIAPHFINSKTQNCNKDSSINWKWSISCLVIAIFPFLPVEKGESVILLVTGGLMILAEGIMYWRSRVYEVECDDHQSNDKKSFNSTIIQLIFIGFSIPIVADTATRLQSRAGLPLFNQIMGWGLLVGSILFLILHETRCTHNYRHRLRSIYFGLSPAMLFLSISYEVLFYFCFFQLLTHWIELEIQLFTTSAIQKEIKNDQQEFRLLKIRDIRMALMFLFYINLGFFGTGNIASISSFSLEAVYRLTVIFNPFLMGALLVLKLFVPFLILAPHLLLLTRSLQLPKFSIFLLGLSLTDWMTLNFFYLVRDDGSWLEIGTSISHFSIASCFVIFTMILYGGAKVLTDNTHLLNQFGFNNKAD